MQHEAPIRRDKWCKDALGDLIVMLKVRKQWKANVNADHSISLSDGKKSEA